MVLNILIEKKIYIHRDLHSGNILIKCSNRWFRLSKPATTATELSDNEIYGIIPYMSLEIFQGQKYAEASDIYSLGMWEMMTGRRPFSDRVYYWNMWSALSSNWWYKCTRWLY